MEANEKSQINKFLSPLVTYTVCKAPFLEFFVEKEIFAFSDIDIIKAKHQEAEQTSEFYRLIQTRTNSYPILLEGLRRTCQRDIVSILEDGIIPPTLNVRYRVRKFLYDNEKHKRVRHDNPDPVPHSNITFDVSEPVDIFTGRRKEIESLHKMVLRSRSTGKPTVISQVTSISGLGGIGKTQLARQYIKEYASDFDGNCIWLQGETENSLSTGFRTLAKDTLGVKTDDANVKEKDIKSVVSDVYRYFSQSQCLIVFDNVEKCAWLRKYLPKTSNPVCPQIIITSRNREWDKGIEVVDVFELEEEDAFQMVKTGLELENDCSQDEMILKLVRRVQCFPLALYQVISYIYEQQQDSGYYSVETYLSNFEMKERELLSFGNDEVNFDLFNDYTMTTFTTWKMTIERIGEDKIHGDLALQILYSMAYLSPEKIQRELFLRHPKINVVEDDAKLRAAVRLLVKYSMVRGEDHQRLLSIHRLVQEVTRVELTSKKRKLVEPEILASVLKMLGGYEETLPWENVDHMLVAWEQFWKYPDESREFCGSTGEIVTKLLNKGRYSEAVEFGNDAVERLQGILGGGDERIVKILQTVSLAISRLGRTEEALEMNEKLLETLTGIFGEENSQTLSILNITGLMYYEKGMFESSVRLFERVCPTKNEYLKRPIFGTNLALALLHLGRTPESLDILRNIYENLKTAPKNIWRSTLIWVSRTLGLSLIEVDDYDGALKILEENYEKDSTVLTVEERINTCHLIRVIGTVLRKQGNYDGAMETHLDAYQKFVEIYGKEHIYPEICRTEIAENLSCVGNHEEAVAILEVTLPKLETMMPNHYFLLGRKVLFAEALGKQGRDFGRARTILEEVNGTIVERDWTKIDHFRKLVEEITRIQNALNDS